MPKKKFEEIDATADLGIIAYGDDLKSLFSNAAEGLMSLMADINGIAESESLSINITAKDREGLLIKFLNEIIYIKDSNGFLCKRVIINYLDDNNLNADICGETYNPERHQLLSGVKAATYHNLKIEKVGENWQVKIIFDV
ncbi:MAG: archease [Nitrospinae bacterium]|nr:archease [Nitrospinota bacterium]MBI3815138.1 archease [Nitrospinota bacterium]